MAAVLLFFGGCSSSGGTGSPGTAGTGATGRGGGSGVGAGGKAGQGQAGMGGAAGQGGKAGTTGLAGSSGAGGNSGGHGGAGAAGAGGNAGARDAGSLDGAAAALEPFWAAWPIPNSQVDVTAGAPNLESYTDNGDMTVNDNVTGLVWQKAVTTGDYLDKVTAYCSALTLGGHDDWRVPSISEIVSLLDLGQSAPPYISPAFPATPLGGYWSASQYNGSVGAAWVVDFETVNFGNDDGTIVSHSVRCVRTGSVKSDPSAPHYMISAETVYDTRTLLTWQRNVSTATRQAYTWAAAETYCASAAVSAILGGIGRLPTMKELQSIIDYSPSEAAATIDESAFPKANGVFWSASSVVGTSSGFAYELPFGGFGNTTMDTSYNWNARCVR